MRLIGFYFDRAEQRAGKSPIRSARQAWRMTTRERRQQRAEWLVRKDLQELGRDLRSARLAAGLTLRVIAEKVQVAPSTILATERALPPGPRADMLARHAAAVGMRVRIKAYPEGHPSAMPGRYR